MNIKRIEVDLDENYVYWQIKKVFIEDFNGLKWTNIYKRIGFQLILDDKFQRFGVDSKMATDVDIGQFARYTLRQVIGENEDKLVD